MHLYIGLRSKLNLKAMEFVLDAVLVVNRIPARSVRFVCIFVSFETNTSQYLLIPRKHRGARFRGYFRFLVPFSAQLFCFNRARFAEKISKNIFSCTPTNIFSMRLHHARSTFLKQRTHMFALHNSRIVSGRQSAAPDAKSAFTWPSHQDAKSLFLV